MAAKNNGSPREGLTFDDVLIRPGLSEVLPADVDIRSRITRSIAINIPIIASAMDTVTEVQMAIAMAQAGGIGVIHRNLDPNAQAAQVRQVKKFESGMVVNPLTIEPGATLQEALDLMKENRISGIPVVEAAAAARAGQAGRHSHQPRRALRHRSAPARRRTDDQGQARHRARRRRPGRGQAAAAPAPHREAPGGRRPIPLRRPDHGQGHGKGGDQSERLQGRAGPPARRRRHHGRRQGLRAHRGADRGRRRPGRGRHRARPFALRARCGQPHQEAVERGAGRGRQCRHVAKAPRR